jgi:hypothetical protein
MPLLEQVPMILIEGRVAIWALQLAMPAHEAARESITAVQVVYAIVDVDGITNVEVLPTQNVAACQKDPTVHVQGHQ